MLIADEVEEAGDVLQTAGRGGVGAEDGNALACDVGELVVGPGAGDRRLVEEFAVDEVAVAAAFVAFSAVTARNPSIRIGAKVSSNHGAILKKDFAAIAASVREVAALDGGR